MKKRKAVYDPEADKRWADKNREHRTYLSSRSAARSFIRNRATPEDLEELEELIQIKRRNNMKDIRIKLYAKNTYYGNKFNTSGKNLQDIYDGLIENGAIRVEPEIADPLTYFLLAKTGIMKSDLEDMDGDDLDNTINSCPNPSDKDLFTVIESEKGNADYKEFHVFIDGESFRVHEFIFDESGELEKIAIENGDGNLVATPVSQFDI